MSTNLNVNTPLRGGLVNNGSLRKALTAALALIVLLSCLFPFITYPVPNAEGYDAAAALTKAMEEYAADLAAYDANVRLRDETRAKIRGELEPAVDDAITAMDIRMQSAGPQEDISAFQAEVDAAKAELTAARKTLSGLQNLIAPVPPQNPVPAGLKEEVTSLYTVTGLDMALGRLAAANALGALLTLIPGVVLMAAVILLTLLNVPLKVRKPVALFGMMLFVFSALRIETSGAKELGAIAKVYSFGFGYNTGIIASVLLLLNVLFEEKRVNISFKSVVRFASDKAIYLVLLALVAVIAIINPRFLSTSTFINIIQQSSTRLIIAMGMSFVIIGTGGVDLSASRMVGMTAVISASLLQNADYSRLFFPNLPQLPVIVPFVLSILIALAFGLMSGVIVAKLNVPPFITTLASQVIVYGATSIYFNLPPNNSQPIGGLREDLTYLGTGEVYGFIPIIVLIALVVCLAVWFLQNKTVFGKNVYAIGGNREAAKVSGINVPLTVIVIFALASALIGMAGVLEAARTGGATNNYGVGYELDAIAACVVGGVSSSGGVGTVGGVVSGVFIFQVINYGLTFIGVNPYWQQIIKGIIIASAVGLDIRKYVNKK